MRERIRRCRDTNCYQLFRLPAIEYPVIRSEEQIEIFRRLGQKEGLHAIIEGVIVYVFDGREAAGDASRFFDRRQDRLTDGQEERVLGRLVQIHG